MDRPKRDWSWLAQHMPRVVAMLRERRANGQGMHIDECWRRGVIDQEPGWFYASEAGVSLGVPDQHLLADPVLVDLRAQFSGAAVLLLKNQPRVVDGT
jgi:hypothetical protein